MRTPVRLLALALLVTLPALARAEEKKPAPPKGLRVFTCGHSFHVFVPGILADIANKAGIADHKLAGLSSIGGSRVIQHWDAVEITLKGEKKPVRGELVKADEKEVVYRVGKKEQTVARADVVKLENRARVLLGKGEVDVLTLSPIYLPDDGIEKFARLALDKNPNVRVTVQEFWLPFDIYNPKFEKRPKSVDHDAATGKGLREIHKPYFDGMDAHVRELNKKLGKQAVFVVPVGQAVIALREKIIAGEAPGLKKQGDLFTDALGHVKAPVMALNAYCHYAVIYRRSPVGLPMPAVLVKGKGGPYDDKLNRLLQELAWDAVVGHPLSGVKADAKR